MNYVESAGWAFIIVGLLAAVGIVLALVIGLPIIRRLGTKAGGLFVGNDASFRIRPEYSTAEARVNQGRFAEAVAEYRLVIEKHPTDVYAHLRIAEMMVERFNNPKAAELELIPALAKATAPDAFALVSHRLADLYQYQLPQADRARAVMESLKAKLPGTKHAASADQRLAALQDGAAPKPEVPKTIAFRPTNEETLRKRRGY
jgi:hypothetical protein